MDDSVTTEVLPAELAAQINETRKAIIAYREHGVPKHWEHPDPHGLGRLEETLDFASGALFNVLNTASSWLDSKSAKALLQAQYAEVGLEDEFVPTSEGLAVADAPSGLRDESEAKPRHLVAMDDALGQGRR